MPTNAKPNVLVEVFNSQGTKVGEATTNSNGQVTFTALPVGVYSLKARVPEGYALVSGHSENQPVDCSFEQVDLGVGYQYTLVGNIVVTKNTTKSVVAVVSSGIFIDVIVTWTLGTNIKIKMQMASTQSESINATFNWNLRKDDGDGQMVLRAAGGTFILTIPQGSLVSNEITLVNPAADFDTAGATYGVAPALNDSFELFVTDKPSTAVVRDTGGYIELTAGNQVI